MKTRVKKLIYRLIVSVVIMILLVIGSILWVDSNKEDFCFYRHLSDAIKVNEKRSGYYAEKTGDFSIDVSNELIGNEKLLKLTALIIDIRSQKFIKEGIPIVCGDFVEMDLIESKETKPEYIKVASDAIFNKLDLSFQKVKKRMIDSNRQNDFESVGEMAYELLLEVKQIEEEEKSSFCMTKHVIESLGLAAIHAKQYSSDSLGQVNGLAQSFLKVKISGISSLVLEIDRGAQKSHNKGVGIVCNDVPKIPFIEEYEKNNILKNKNEN